ncbi:Phosphate metabolism protein 7 [Saccharomyces cerevisiae S288c] [Rhizoctonia solani]|uniref:Phosphate metabolism protein 7 [Saccharomyces cerevisiae S288c] n=1 Tax=Rhizoctonia solani TaxID=456999 RepID=A0A0K6G362_9AGAM|nr:Phosphate metabolism protein 7 [Saccharomyces cerevisiae S288c] [Rhizoctonia solani]
MSIDPTKATSTNNTSRTFGTAFVTNIALLAIQVGGFVILKKKFYRIYSPRTELPPPGKRTAELPSGPWKWLPAVIFAPTEDIIRKNGLDAYLFLRFLRLMILIFGVFTLISWPILLPVNSINMPGGGSDGLVRLSWSNITEDQHNRYIAHVILVYIMTFFVFYLIRRELLIFVHARHQFLISRSHSHLAQAKTVLITSMPNDLCEETALRRFCAFVPGGINKVWIYRDQPDLPKLYNDRLEICQQLEQSMVKYMRAITKAWRKHKKAEKTKAKARSGSGKDIEAVQENPHIPDSYPLTRLSTVRASLLNQPLPPTPRHSGVTPTNKTGELVLNAANQQQGSSGHLRLVQEIARLNIEINEKRKGLPECEPHGSAFIQCNLQMGAHVLAQCVSYHEPLKMSQKWIEVSPDDIIWDNIDDGAYEVRSRYVLSWLLTFAVIALWFVPTTFAGILSNVDQLCSKATWLQWVCRLPDVVQGIIQGVLPPAVIAILFLLLPIYLRAMAVFECIPRHSLVSISLYKRYYLFLVVHGFLTITLASGIISTIVPILEQPSKAVELLAKNLPNASIFFLTYIVANGLAGSASALAQIGPLAVHFLKKHLFGSTPRQSFEITFMMPQADFGVVLPRMSLLCTIAFAYSVIAPVISGLALLAFILYYVAWKFLFLWVYDQPDAQETGGLYFPLIVSNLFVGLYIEQLCLAGLFFLDARKTVSLVLDIFIVILLVITIGVQILLRKSFDPITEFLPMSMATKSLHDRQRRHQKHNQDPANPVTSDVEEEEMDLFKRDRLQTLIRRKVNKKLKLPTKPKEDKDTGFAPPAPAAQPGPSKLPDVAPQLSTPKLLTRTNTKDSHDSARSKRSNKSKKTNQDELQIAPAAPAQKTSITGDDASSEDDSDLDDFAFDHPNTYKDAPWIWIPKDTLGISAVLLKELHAAKVEASDSGSKMDEKGLVTVSRSPPDEAWSGGLDL